MKKYVHYLTPTLAGAVVLLLAGSMQAQPLSRYDAQAGGSQVMIEGTSSIHNWDVKSPIIGGYLEIDGAFLQKPAAGKVTANGKVTIPVRSLKSYMTAMDDVMQEHMNFKQYKTIQYKLSELSLKETPKDPKGPLTLDSKGELTVSGKTNVVSFPVTITQAEGNKLKISAAKIPLKMTSFGIKPPAPKLGMGAITTGDDVQISFDWITAKSDGK